MFLLDKLILRCIILITCITYFSIDSLAAIGQSSVITLVFPHGARQYGMGEVGTALADDEHTLFWNPAGLGIKNEELQGGAFGIFYEPLLPAFDIPDLWHSQASYCKQTNIGGTHGFGVDFNYLNLGESSIYDAMGSLTGSVNSYEWVVTAGYGFSYGDPRLRQTALGGSVKFLYSALAPGIGEGDEGTAKGVAFDAGLLYQLNPFTRFGLTFANMGPAVFYISKDEADPIPFTINLALAYESNPRHLQQRCQQRRSSPIDIKAEIRIEREIVYNEAYENPSPFFVAIFKGLNDEPWRQELKEVIVHCGLEYTLGGMFSSRIGFFIDEAGSRREFHWGCGLKLGNVKADYYYIYSPKWSIARDGQWGFSLKYMFRTLYIGTACNK